MAKKMQTGRLALAGVMAAATLASTTGCVVVVGGKGGHWDDWDDDRVYVVEHHRKVTIRPVIGVTTSGLSESLATQLQVNPRRATLITGVNDNTPAMRAGMRRWDVIVSINGNDHASPDRLRDAIRSTEPGEVVALEVLRESQLIEIDVEPALRKSR